MSFSLTASEFVCSTLPLLFEFCIAQFFVPYALFLYLDGNFVLYFHFVKHGCGGFAVDFHSRQMLAFANTALRT